jgi:hypothetical protein
LNTGSAGNTISFALEAERASTIIPFFTLFAFPISTCYKIKNVNNTLNLIKLINYLYHHLVHCHHFHHPGYLRYLHHHFDYRFDHLHHYSDQLHHHSDHLYHLLLQHHCYLPHKPSCFPFSFSSENTERLIMP